MSYLNKPRKGMLLGGVWDWIKKGVEGAAKHSGLIKTGISALSTYAAYKDQKKKNELQQEAYRDYMKAAADAGKEAEAAVDLNLTPMTISGVPTTKADVTDFTAVAAKGGLMSIPTKQRKRYARGPEAVEVMEMDEESITPFGLQQETGIDFTGEQAFYNTGRGDRANAAMIWDQMSSPDKSLFDFDFEIFFLDGGWRDMIKGEAPAVLENTMMASAPTIEDSQNEMAMNMFGKPYHELNQMEIDALNEYNSGLMAKGGIAGLRKKYAIGTDVEDVEMMDEEFVGDNELKMEEGVQIGPMAGGGARGWKAQEIAMDWAYERYGKEFYDLSDAIQMQLYSEALDFVDSGGMKKGGRVKRNVGGIMDLGGLEKDYRFSGGFVPIGAYEKKDDVPARLSKNEFVFTADAVRAAGGGSINKGAKRMYDTMKHLEARPEAKRMTA